MLLSITRRRRGGCCRLTPGALASSRSHATNSPRPHSARNRRKTANAYARVARLFARWCALAWDCTNVDPGLWPALLPLARREQVRPVQHIFPRPVARRGFLNWTEWTPCRGPRLAARCVVTSPRPCLWLDRAREYLSPCATNSKSMRLRGAPPTSQFSTRPVHPDQRSSLRSARVRDP